MINLNCGRSEGDLQDNRKIEMNHKLADLAHTLDHEPFVLVVTEQRCLMGRK